MAALNPGPCAIHQRTIETRSAFHDILHRTVEGAGDDFFLLLPVQTDEVDGIAGYSYGQLRIVVWVLHGLLQHDSFKYIDVYMMPALYKITVQQRCQVRQAGLCIPAQGSGYQRQC